MIIDELWSKRDEASAARCIDALAADDLAGALLAVEGAPADQVATTRAQLDAWGETLSGRLVGLDGAARAIAETLASYLGGELDFRGDQERYYDPENSQLTRVITRRRGLPILLSAVWIEVGRRAGVTVEGVGMPGHFLARVGAGAGQLVDPFAGGRLLQVADCERIVHDLSEGKLPWRDDHLARVGATQIVERVLQNLVNATARANDARGLYRAFSYLFTLRPDVPAYCLKRASAAEALGARGEATEIYAEVMRLYPGSQEAATAAERRRTQTRPLYN